MQKRPNILVAALNWGIGHATRDIPIIDRLIERGCNVILASDGAALSVWKRTYPELTHVELPSWNIKYHKKGTFMLKMATRAPFVVRAIQQEQNLVDDLINDYQIDGIISDNRFGVFSKRIPTVFITHQISLRLHPSVKFAEPWLNYFNHHYIKKFDTVWVPDFKEKPNLSGELSHKHLLSHDIQFLGPISRFMDIWDGEFPPIDNDIAIVLSGVEPQRTIFEEKLIEQLLPQKDLKVILVQGKSNGDKNEELRDGFVLKSFMDSEELLQTFLRSKYIISRSGYSTILDLAVLKQTAFMVPTPGQTEQEYLANWMTKEGLIVSQKQKNLDILSGLQKLEHTKGFQFDISDEKLQNAIDEFLAKL